LFAAARTPSKLPDYGDYATRVRSGEHRSVMEFTVDLAHIACPVGV
jgi:hypothetical protein